MKHILKALKYTLRTAAALLALTALCAVLLYLPPVQQFIVDRVCESIEKDTTNNFTEVSVGTLRIGFPLDIHISDVLVIQDKDTMLSAGDIAISIQLLPLLDGSVEMDTLALHGIKVNTLDLIPALKAEGMIGELTSVSHSSDLRSGTFLLNSTLLKNSDLTITLADTVPEDTTEEEEGLMKKLTLEKVNIENTSLRILLPPQADSTSIYARLGQAAMKVDLDLVKSNYDVSDLHLTSSDIAYTSKDGAYEMKGMDLDIASLRYTADGSIKVGSMNIKTSAKSDLDISVSMDGDAFASQNPGRMQVSIHGMADKADIVRYASPSLPTLSACWPDKPARIDIELSGNMQHMDITQMDAAMEGHFQLASRASIHSMTDIDNIAVDANISAEAQDIRFVSALLPKEAATAIRIPTNLNLTTDLTYASKAADITAAVRTGRSSLKATATADLGKESYKAHIKADNFRIEDFVRMTERADFTGTADITGQGFDITSSKTRTDLRLILPSAHYGNFSLHDTDLSLKLAGRSLSSDFTAFLRNKADSIQLDAIGFIGVRYDASLNFDADAHMDVVKLISGRDSIMAEALDMSAEASRERTYLSAVSGDMDIYLDAPYHYEKLISKATKAGDIALHQLQTHTLNIETLKRYIPVMTLSARIGTDNPVYQFMKIYEIGYDEITADIHTSPESGLQGHVHTYALQTDSLQFDTITADIHQDSTQITFNLGLRCSGMKEVGDFTAKADGYLSPDDGEVRVLWLDKEENTGIDLGLHAQLADSMLRLKMIPEKPIIAYKPFTVSEGNYINLKKRNRMFADLTLTSLDDSCTFSIKANPADDELQNILCQISNLDLTRLHALLPMLPHMSGLINTNLDYIQTEEKFSVSGDLTADSFCYEGTRIGTLGSTFRYNPIDGGGHSITATLSGDGTPLCDVSGTYNAEEELDMTLTTDSLPLAMASAFVPDHIVSFTGDMTGSINVKGPIDKLIFNGNLTPHDFHVRSELYSFDLRVEDEPITFDESIINFNQIKIYGAGDNPLTVKGYVDFADLDEIGLSMSLYGKNFEVMNAPRTRKAALFGKVLGDFFVRVTGTTDDMTVRGMVSVLSATDMTYIMTNTPLTIDYRLDDIVTFVDFSLPPEPETVAEHKFSGIDMRVTLEVEDGAKINCEFSADKQSYMNIQGGGTLSMTYSPEGVLNLTGRYTISEGEMKYTLPIIPLKTFYLQKGSYIEFTGIPSNPTLSIEASERTNANVSNDDGSSRSVVFDTGLRISGTLMNMGLEFTIDAPEDMTVQNELAGMTAEEKNKLAVGLLSTGMYLSSTNATGFTASNALNNFLQTEINNIAGKALNSVTNMDMDLGLEQTKRDDGTTRTDYSFKFTKRFFSDRLNVVIGGKVNADGSRERGEKGAYLDDIALEWRLDKSGSQYVKLFHQKNYDNLVEGELTSNGIGLTLRKKMERWNELWTWMRRLRP